MFEYMQEWARKEKIKAILNIIKNLFVAICVGFLIWYSVATFAFYFYEFQGVDTSVYPWDIQHSIAIVCWLSGAIYFLKSIQIK